MTTSSSAATSRRSPSFPREPVERRATGFGSARREGPRSRTASTSSTGGRCPRRRRVPEARFVELAQLYGSYALVLNEDGEEFAPDPISWAETDLVQAIARQPGGRAWYVVDEPTLELEVRGRTVRAMIEAAREAGGTVLTTAELGFDLPESYRYAVHVAAGVTHTVGGLKVDDRARVLDERGLPIEGLFAAGVDAGGIAVGGYASGLATALVLGLTAAESLGL